MKPEYEAWIAEYRVRYPDEVDSKGRVWPGLRARCGTATIEMQKAFPELTRVPGIVLLVDDDGFACGSSEHWWLVDDAQNIVDPTASQFIDQTISEYRVWQGPVPTGKCPNCGDLCYDHRYLCSEECEVSYAAYVNSFSRS